MCSCSICNIDEKNFYVSVLHILLSFHVVFGFLRVFCFLFLPFLRAGLFPYTKFGIFRNSIANFSTPKHPPVKENYYELLNISKGASQEEIKKSFHELGRVKII